MITIWDHNMCVDSNDIFNIKNHSSVSTLFVGRTEFYRYTDIKPVNKMKQGK